MAGLQPGPAQHLLRWLPAPSAGSGLAPGWPRRALAHMRQVGQQVIELRRLIRELGRTHTVILSSHILSEVKAVCDKALILSQGHLAAVVDLAAEERDLEELFLELTAPEETSDKKED